MVSFSVDTTDGAARLGTLITTHGALTTPLYLVHTKDGNPACLTPDILAGMQEVKAMHITLHDILELKDVLQKYGKGAHQFLNLSKYALFLSLRDPKVFSDCPSANSSSLSINSKKGNTKISTQEFVQMMGSFKLDVFASMFFDVAWDSSLKRSKKSVELAVEWLDYVLAQLPQHAKESVFGVIEGGRFLDQRIKSAKETALRPVAGFIIGGMDSGETPQDRALIVDTIVENLPVAKPRMIIGPGCPEDVLDLIERGLDVFCNLYPQLMTDHGYALTFNLDSTQQAQPRKLNMRDPKYIIDTQALLPGCKCYTCMNHTRAYVYHLLNVHEMLSEVLLEIHNLHHYMDFFRVIREAIKAGCFADYKKWFLMVPH